MIWLISQENIINKNNLFIQQRYQYVLIVNVYVFLNLVTLTVINNYRTATSCSLRGGWCLFIVPVSVPSPNIALYNTRLESDSCFLFVFRSCSLVAEYQSLCGSEFTFMMQSSFHIVVWHCAINISNYLHCNNCKQL